MKKKQSYVIAYILPLLMLFLSGCASTGFSEVESLAAPSDQALIFFYRTGSGGGAIKFHVHDMNGDPVGYLGQSGDSFSIIVPPGTHRYWSRAARVNEVSLTVEAGKIYYVKATVNMGFAVGRPVLEQVNKDAVPQ
jgi:hypothetical protein